MDISTNLKTSVKFRIINVSYIRYAFQQYILQPRQLATAEICSFKLLQNWGTNAEINMIKPNCF